MPFIGREPPFYSIQSAYEVPALCVNTGNATYTFTSVVKGRAIILVFEQETCCFSPMPGDMAKLHTPFSAIVPIQNKYS